MKKYLYFTITILIFGAHILLIPIILGGCAERLSDEDGAAIAELLKK